jgi:hypothetical protein
MLSKATSKGVLKMNLSLTLDSEFKRVAKAEQVSMDDLVNECARLVECSTRQIYNYRSGKWSLPAEMIPTLCKRFGSLALMHTLAEACRETPIEIPEKFELTRMVAQTVRDDMRLYERFLDAFEDGVIEKNELDDLRARGERVIQNVRQFEGIAAADYERRCRLKST